MATTPQGMTQGFLQSAGNLQTTAQNNVPFSANNGNPYTIYNQTPQQGGYLPPVSNAYDQWRINPMQSYGGGQINFGNMGGGGFPQFTSPNFNGGGGMLPVFPPNPNGGNTPPPVTVPNTTPTGNGSNPNMYTIGSGGWMANGPTVLGMGGDNGSLNTSYTNAGFGLFGSGYNGMNGGGNTGTGSNPFANVNLGGTLGNIADWFVPGDAFQREGINYGNVGLGIAGQQTGLPLTWLAGRLADTNWAQTSDNSIARWLRNWNESNDAEAMHQYYDDPANGTRGAMEGWLAGAYEPADPNVLTPEQQQAQYDRAMALFNARATSRSAEDIYRREGVLGLQRAGYNPNQINAITGQGAGVNGGMGIGLHASGAFTPGMANVLQGDAARSAFAAMVNSQRMQPTFQRHNNQN